MTTGGDPDIIYESADFSRSSHTCENAFLSVWAVVCLHLIEIEIEVEKVSIKASEICVSSITNNYSGAPKRKSISKIHRPFKKQGWGDFWNFECPKPKYTGKAYLSIGRREKKKRKKV